MPGSVTISSSASYASAGGGTNLQNLDPFTFLTYLKLDNSTNRTVWSRDNAGGIRKRLSITSSSAAGNLSFAVARATANTQVVSSTRPMTSGLLLGLAAVFSSTSTSANDWMHVFVKTTGAATAEISYAVRSSGSGAVTSDSSGSTIWGGSTNTVDAMLGDLVTASAIFAAKLTSGDIDSWFKCPRKTVGSNVARQFIRWGKSSGSQSDYSTNANNCTLTGSGISTTGNGVGIFLEEANTMMLGNYALGPMGTY